MDNLSSDIFFKEITYLPFDEVKNLCKVNRQMYDYCTNDRYRNQWKSLIDNTFSSIEGYQEKLDTLLKKYGTYNYFVYTGFVKFLDPITQAMIYYRQGNRQNFEDFTQKQKFLALFLLNKKDEITKYLPNDKYQPFIDMLNGKDIPEDIRIKMLTEMIQEGNIKGVKIFKSVIRNNYYAVMPRAIDNATKKGYLDVLKYLYENTWENIVRGAAMKYYNIDLIKYFIKIGENIDSLFLNAVIGGNIDSVKYLLDKGADIHASNNRAIKLADEHGHYGLVTFLLSNGIDINEVLKKPLDPKTRARLLKYKNE